MVVQVKHMGLLHPAVDQTDLGWVPHVGFQDWGRGIAIGPGAHGNILVNVRRIAVWVQG